MKTLLVLRHAKSSWKKDAKDDHDRPLNKRGLNDAPLMGELLKTEDIVPDQIICSTARRARHTAQLVAEAAVYDGKPDYTRDLYTAESEHYLTVLREKANDVDTVMVVGHNPSVTDLVDLLTGGAEEMPTAALARIELPIDDWADLDGDVEGNLLTIWRPRELADRRL